MRLVFLAMLAACAGTTGGAPAHPRASPELAAIEASGDLDGAPVGASRARATIVFVFASWCPHCHRELAVLDGLRTPAVRVLGVNYRGHEEYDGRGDAEAVRRYVAEHAPWLRVVPAGDELFELLGRPSKIPTLYVYDAAGARVAIYDRRDRPLPGARELRALLDRLVSDPR